MRKTTEDEKMVAGASGEANDNGGQAEDKKETGGRNKKKTRGSIHPGGTGMST